MYFYHPDHLGSSSYITDREGRITQHTEYIAFGEVLFEEHSTSKTMPYLFNGKELDSETNLTYFGARYLDMKTSLWLNTDPLSGYNPIQETEHHIDGQHNGGIYNYSNLNTYIYTYQNPVKYIDPNGKQFIPAPIQPLIRPTITLGKADIVTTTETMARVSSRTTETISRQQQHFTRGRKIEAEQIEQMINEGQSISRNTQPQRGIDPKTGKEGTTIPDAKTSSGRYVEIKNVKKQSYTRQLRIQDAISKGRLILRINKDAKLTKPLLESGIEIQFYGTGMIKMDGGIRAQHEKKNIEK